MSDEPQPLTVVKDGEAPNIDMLARADLSSIFSPFKANIEKLIVTAGTIKVTSADDKTQIKLARETRLSLKRSRIAVKDIKDKLKSGVLKLGRAIDERYNEFLDLIEPVEKALAEQEKIAERLEAERAAKLAGERIEQLKALDVDGTHYLGLGSMDETTWDQLLENSKLAKQKRDEEAARAQQEAIQKENERLQREKEAEAERQRVLAENERLKAEAAEREKAAAAHREADEKARAEKERQEAEALQKRQELQGERVVQLLTIGFDGRQYDLAAMSVDQFAELLEMKRAEVEAEIAERKERQRQKEADEAEKARLKQIADEAEAQRLAAEQRAAEERKQAEDTARLEREKAQKEFEARLAESNRKAQEAQRAADDAAQAERDRLECESIAEKARLLEAERARTASDSEKLIALAATLRATVLPEMVSEAGALAVSKVEREIEFLAKFIEEKAGKL